MEAIVFYENPLIKFNRIVTDGISQGDDAYPEFENAFCKWTGHYLYQVTEIKLAINDVIPSFDCDNNLYFCEHHVSHASSAFYPSPFIDAAVLTFDGVGERATATLSLGDKNRLSVVKEMHFPNSLGLLYSAFTFYTGFKVNSANTR